MTSFRTLETDIVTPKACCGCGICAGVCPESAIAMRFNAIGEYRPYEQNEACTKCGLCLKVCPFNAANPDQDALAAAAFPELGQNRYAKEAGMVEQCLVGYAPDETLRRHGASGGLVTWALSALMETGKIDQVIAVHPGHDHGVSYRYQVVHDLESIKRCSKSAYYPVEMSAAVKHLLSHEGRYAVVALPCAAKGLRHLMAVSAIAHRRIVYLFGLVCGKNKSRFYLDALLAQLPLAGPVQQICFRDKTGTQKADDFFFSAEDSGGQTHRIRWSQGVNRLFCQPWFDLKACRLCDDIFAECADTVFMDAWLPEYSADPRGTSFILSRKAELSFQFGKITQPIALQKVIQSQQAVIRRKRLFLERKLHQSNRNGRVHLSLVRKWRIYLPQNWLRWKFLQAAINKADTVDGLIAADENWFPGFREIFNGWQKVEKNFARAEQVMALPRRCAGLVLRRKMPFTSNPVKRVLIAHIPNTFNYGSAMMAINLIAGLRSKLGHSIELYCDCDGPDLERLQIATDDRQLKCFIPEPLKTNRTLGRKIYELFSGNNPFVKSIANNFDVMIVLGGDDLSEVYMKSAIIQGLLYRRINRQCKVILAGQSLGPFNGIYKFLAGFIFRDMILITRDDNSFYFAKDKLKIKKIIQSSDLAFNDLPNQKKWDKILEKFNLTPDEYLVVVPSGLVAKYTSDYSAYIDVWRNLLAYLLSTAAAKKIVVLAHVLKPESVNDATVINKIVSSEELSQKQTILAITTPMQPAEARAILGGAKYVVTGRMHAAVSTFFSGKPAISLAYSEKYAGVIGKGLNLPSTIIDCRKFEWKNTSEILGKIINTIDLISNNQQLKDNIYSSIENCRSKNITQIQFIANEIISSE